jgi:hypothetical protein
MHRFGGAPPSADLDIVWPFVSPKPSTLPVAQLGPRDGSIFSIPGVLTHAEAAAVVAATEAAGYAHQGSRGAAAGEAARSCGRLSLRDAGFASALWKAIRGAVLAGLPPADRDAACGLNDNIRCYRYERGDAFGRHYDDDEVVDADKITRYTLLIYLTPCTGGATVFYAGEGKRKSAVVASVAPAPGLALLHRHGDLCLPHEGARVEGGVKYVLRSDVVFRMG